MRTLKYYITFLALSFSLGTYAQLKFEDIFEQESSHSLFDNVMRYRDLQANAPKDPAINYRFSKVYMQMLKEAHPIHDFSFIKTTYIQINVHNGLVIRFLDEKQARQNRKYFGAVQISGDKKKASYEDIKSHIINEKQEIDDYFTKVEQLYTSYVNCTDLYNACLVSYRDLLSRYAYEKSLTLLTNIKTLDIIDSLKSDFDKCIRSIEIYKDACQYFTQFLERPTYVIVPIETYRLEGLIETKFYESDFDLWDYESWANHFKEVYNDEILAMRSELIVSNTKLNEEIDKYSSFEFFDGKIEPYHVNERLRNLVGRYDYRALCIDMFNYKEEKLSLLTALHEEVCNPYDTIGFAMNQRLRYFEALSEDLLHLNQSGNEFFDKISTETYVNYESLFNDEFQSLEGFERWARWDYINNFEQFNLGLENLNTSMRLEKQNVAFDDSSYVKSKLGDVAYGVQQCDSIIENQLVTDSRFAQNRTHTFLMGRYANSSSRLIPFTASVKPDSTLAWIRLIEPDCFKSQDTIQTKAFQKVGDGSVLFLQATHLGEDSTSITSSIVFVDGEGQIKELFSTDSIGEGLDIFFDEISEDIVLMCDHHGLEIAKYSIDGELRWQKKINEGCDYVGMIPTNGNYFLLVNVEDDLKSNFSKSILVDSDGEILHSEFYQFDQAIVFERIFKVNSKRFNFIGRYNEKNFLYLISNEEGKLIFSNIVSEQNVFADEDSF